MSDRPSSPHPPVAPGRLWSLIGGMGLLFLAVAGTDNVLTWIPPDFGNREWVFGTVTASFNGFLSISFGFAMVQLWLSQGDRAWPLRALGIVLAVVGTAMIAAAILYWTNVPVALAAVSDSPARPGLLKAVIKTSFQSVVYPLAFFLMARAALVWAGQIARAMAGESKGSEGVGIIGRS